MNGPRPERRSEHRLLGSAARAAVLAWRSGRALLLGSLAGSVLVGLLPTGTALLVRDLFDTVVRNPSDDRLWRTAGLLAAATLAMAVLPALTSYLQAQHARRVQLRVQDELFEGVNRLPGLRHFEDPAFQDELRLAQQSGQTVPSQLIGSAVSALQAAVTLAGFLTTVFVLNPVLGALVVLAALPVLGTQLTAGRRQAVLQQGITPALRRQMFYGSLLTDVDAVKEIRLFGLQDFFRGRAHQELASAVEAERRTARRNLLWQLPPSVLVAVVYGVGLFWAVREARAGALSLGDVSVFLAAVAGVQGGVTQIAGTGGSVYQGLLTFGSYRAVLGTTPDLALPGTAVLPVSPVSAITVEDVWFRYHEDAPWVLRGVDLTIPVGGTLALVGLNGAGKSTLVKLLCRLYDPTRGTIRWDGTDIREFTPEQLRERIGVVFQDYCHYDLTAGENVGLGRIDRLHDAEAVADAARAAGIHTRLTELPDGYRTLLSRMFAPDPGQGGSASGTSLSGGEWQRVAVARAFMRRDSDLLILDEPSAGLDAEAEKEIHDHLRTLRAGTTAVVISHRLSSVRDADRIAVLRDGRIAELGDHRRLMELGGDYARLFDAQADGYRDPADDRQTIGASR
ncbi:multidrug ABC transporter permease [Kitasatospora phosalacinea]|uniref:Multidrug ABC transporter permease n=1 Tax=Kitasatospora phosalacinea TaxID=2065 RepID=A0A9W6V166_9ACTN|nr:ABC transporter ATP-binding protein [Kitasatospora phosalacinea]GLW68585.1 multidrug ABC transporter permease [Kitasatospora phosalacinea]